MILTNHSLKWTGGNSPWQRGIGVPVNNTKESLQRQCEHGCQAQSYVLKMFPISNLLVLPYNLSNL